MMQGLASRSKRIGDANCSDPTCWGRNYILNWVFFVQTILADRYIHRRDMCVVSLKSSSSVDLGIKKISLNFVFFPRSYQGLKFCVNTGHLA